MIVFIDVECLEQLPVVQKTHCLESHPSADKTQSAMYSASTTFDGNAVRPRYPLDFCKYGHVYKNAPHI